MRMLQSRICPMVSSSVPHRCAQQLIHRGRHHPGHQTAMPRGPHLTTCPLQQGLLEGVQHLGSSRTGILNVTGPRHLLHQGLHPFLGGLGPPVLLWTRGGLLVSAWQRGLLGRLLQQAAWGHTHWGGCRHDTCLRCQLGKGFSYS